MSVIAMRDLTRKTRQVVEEVKRTGKPAIITQYGRPTVAVINVPGDGELEDLVLAHAPRFLRAMQEAEADAAAGRITPLAKLRKEPEGDTRPARRVSGSAGRTSPRAPARKGSRTAARRAR
jgi:prevent-host-death family protein